MILASDLRLGNWVQTYMVFDNGMGLISEENLRCTQIDIESLKIISESFLATYKPIELTEDILQKNGFVITDDIGGNAEVSVETIFYRNTINVAQRNSKFYLWVDIDEDSWYSFAWTEIKYIHELQNLFYALTKKELEIQLT